MNHGTFRLAATEDINRSLLVLGLEVVHDIRNSLGVGRDGQMCDEVFGVLVLVLPGRNQEDRSEPCGEDHRECGGYCEYCHGNCFRTVSAQFSVSSVTVSADMLHATVL